MNREQKRLLQRQGELGPDGEQLPPQRQPARTISSRPPGAKRANPIAKLGEVRNELKKVVWPTRLEVRNYSIVVLATLLVVMALILALDYVFSEAAVFLFR